MSHGKANTMAKSWIFQKPRDLKKLGQQNAPYHVGWRAPDGSRHSKSCGPGRKGQKLASQLRDQIEAQLILGTYEAAERQTWEQFIAEYRPIMDQMEPATFDATKRALESFTALAKPHFMAKITTKAIDEFIAARRGTAWKKGNGGARKAVAEPVSAATVNKELRHLKAAINRAVRWGYMKAAPEFAMLREVVRLKEYVTPEDFAKLYGACEHATRPELSNVSAADWWRGLLVTGYMTGWRIGQMLALRWSKIDLDTGTVHVKGETTKGKRDEKVPLHPLVVEHLRKLKGSWDKGPFPWDLSPRAIYNELDWLCHRAGVKHYTFHDLRRAFATMNADRMTPEALQALMQHKSFATTQTYIRAARQLKGAVDGLFVPNLGVPEEPGQKETGS